MEIPDGVDPSFLAALPENIRQEVIAEQLRLQRIRRSDANTAQQPQPADAAAAPSTSGASAFTEVNPEFLAALPANIQEEVLAQQAAEQQRLATLNSNPDAPVDPGIFIQTLAPSLRRQVLTDMDDSVLSLLPSDLAAEAHALRRDFLTSHVSASSTLSRLLRHASGRMGRARYTISTSASDHHFRHTHVHRPWNWSFEYPGNAPIGHGSGITRALTNAFGVNREARFKGRQLLDCEALSCLIILLFVDEPRLNISRLHRVLRNLSYHYQTRQWIVQSLLSVVDRTKTSSDSSDSGNTGGRGNKKHGKQEGNQMNK